MKTQYNQKQTNKKYTEFAWHLNILLYVNTLFYTATTVILSQANHVMLSLESLPV